MWSWFVASLLEDLGGVEENKWTFISDRQKGLLETLKELAPGCAHRFCVRHIYQNFKQKWSSYDFKNLLWKAASTGNKNDFERAMAEIQRLDGAAASWLRNIPPCHWTRSHFTTRCKSDVLVNNLCESFNNMILQAREKPIISMFEWIRTRMTSRHQTKITGMENYGGSICPNILKKINKYQKTARNCFPRWCGEEEFEVECFMEKYVVHLDAKTCTCGIFQLNGYPCAHAWACIAERRYKVDDFVDPWYKKETYLKTFQYMIHAVPGPTDYIRTPFEPLAAPYHKIKIGRPKKLRRKAPGEIERTTYRKGLTHTCKNCLQQGHNRGTCKNPIHPNSKLYKGTSTPTTTLPTGGLTVDVLAETSRGPRVDASIETSQSQASHVIYQGRRNTTLLGQTVAGSTTNVVVPDKIKRPPSTTQNVNSSNPKKTRKLKIPEVLENIKENSKSKRMWKI